MKRTGIAILAAASITLAGCAGVDSNTAKRTGGGALIGAIAGNPGAGLAIGAVAGATGGFVYDQISKDQGGS